MAKNLKHTISQQESNYENHINKILFSYHLVVKVVTLPSQQVAQFVKADWNVLH